MEVILPVPGTAAPTSLSLKTSTANANDFIIGTFGVEYTYTGTNDIGFAGTSTSLIQWEKATSSRLILDDYKIVSSKQTNFDVGFAWNSKYVGPWGMIADAIMEQGSTYIIPSPTSGNVVAQVSVSGSNFGTSKTLTAKFGSTSLTLGGTTITDGTGAFSGMTFFVPSSTSDSVAGAHTITVTDSSSKSCTTSFTILPSISLSPTSGHSTSTVTVSGSGFAASSTITIKFNFNPQTTSPVTTSTSGTFSGVTFSVPTSTPDGSYPVSATDASSNTASSTFIVDTVAPTLSIAAPTSSQYFKTGTVGVSGTASDAGSGLGKCPGQS